MIKLRMVFNKDSDSPVIHDPGFGIQPQLVNDLLTMLGTFGTMYDGRICVPQHATFDTAHNALMIGMVPYTEVPMKEEQVSNVVHPPEFFNQKEELEEGEGQFVTGREQLTPEDRRKLFKVLTTAREENEDE